MIVIVHKKPSKPQLTISNVIAGVRPNLPFWLFISDFVTAEQRLSKNTVFSTASKIPLPVTEVGGDMGREFAGCLNITKRAIQRGKRG